ncbi:MAG: hypothetical protein QM658_01925 [Gordonia sp. (in: high G+C Gram-positive bacteria)]
MLDKVQEKIMWHTLSAGVDDERFPLDDFYSAARYYLGPAFTDPSGLLVPVIQFAIAKEYVVVGEMVEVGLAPGGKLPATVFTPIAIGSEQAFTLVSRYIAENQERDPNAYAYWFVLTEKGESEMLRYWETHD